MLTVFKIGFAVMMTAAIAAASNGFDLPSPTGPYTVGTTTWRLTDASRRETFSASGEYRNVEVLAWYPAAGPRRGEPEDETMASVTRASDDGEQMRLLRGYLGGLQNTGIALRRWVADTKLVLDRLSSIPQTSPAGVLAARLDTNRLGVFGHSMGGVTAGQFCVEDRRCRAGLNLDGIPQYGTMIDKAMSRPYYRVDVQDTRHLDFCDMAFWGGPLRERPVLGTLNPARISEITRTIVRQYFDQELMGQRSALLAGTPRFPEVTVRKIPAPAR